jgi:hypothetical protein
MISLSKDAPLYFFTPMQGIDSDLQNAVILLDGPALVQGKVAGKQGGW